MASTMVRLTAKQHPELGKIAKQLSDEARRVLAKHCRSPFVQHMEVFKQHNGRMTVLVKFYHEPKSGEETIVGLEEIPF